jgi:hypothetical protein
VARYCERFPKEDKPFTPGPWMDYVRAEGWWNHPTLPDRAEEQQLMAAPWKTSCKQMWGWIREGAKKEVLHVAEVGSINNIQFYGWRIFGADLFYQVIAALAAKLSSDKHLPPDRDVGQDPCVQAGVGGGGGQFANPQDQLLNSVASMMASLYIRKAMITAPSQEMVQRVLFGHGLEPLETMPNEVVPNVRTKEAVLRRQKAQDFAEARKYEAFILLQLLPYIQGLFLYGLAVVYPFFCLMILLPGQAGAFFTWMALWAWAKSWDIGWALVMVADNVLWELFPKSAFFNPQDPEPYRSPVSLLEGAYDGDPAYNMGTYWLMVSMMVSGVPLVSAQAVLGSKKAIAGVFLSGLDSIAQNLGQSAANYVAGEQTARNTQREGQTRALGTMEASGRRFADMHRGVETVDEATDKGPVAIQVDATKEGADRFQEKYDKTPLGQFKKWAFGGGNSAPPDSSQQGGQQGK